MLPEEMLTLAEAAAFLRRHPNSVRLYVQRGLIPGAKVGGNWRFLKEDLVAWLRAEYSGFARVQSSATEEEAIWHSQNVQTLTMSDSQRRTERSLDILLAPPTGKRPKNITTS